jgi:arylsulfatase A-like enzyme
LTVKSFRSKSSITSDDVKFLVMAFKYKNIIPQAALRFFCQIWFACLSVFASHTTCAAEQKPNVLIILTDDQGSAELGVTGNPVVRTPNIDRFAGQGAALMNFNVMPVCSPTRASLMTGRYYYRTGITDTYKGCSLMNPAETTVAEMFAAAGYRTGIFGKWHLGDNYPRRAMDKGFQESLVLNGGGLAQPGDPPDPVDERGAYFNATLRHNGTWIKTDGYVSDVITEAAMQFIETNRSQPFFAYLPFNCPHSPHQVSADYSGHYRPNVFDPTNFPSKGNPMSAQYNPKDLARVYGMIENIDDNVGRLLKKLDELQLATNTIVLLFSDNGCQHHDGFNGGLRGWKGSPWEGGIHQFCFMRWPGQIKPGQPVDRLAASMDITPTLLELCGVAKPERVKFDGRSIAPLLRGEKVAWPDRTMIFQWHRGEAPERYRNMAVRSQDWKLVHAAPGDGEGGKRSLGKYDFQLFDLAHDPFEQHNVAAEQPKRTADLKAAYDAWFNDITNSYNFSLPQRIYIGTTNENPALLTRQDMRSANANLNGKGLGIWELKVVRAAAYDIKLIFEPAPDGTEASLAVNGYFGKLPLAKGAKECEFKHVRLAAGDGRLEAILKTNGALRGIKYAEIKRLD